MNLLHKIGYQKIEHPTKFKSPFQAQSALISNKKTPTIFDVGAHHGETAIAYRKSFPTATLHCFEPFPDSLAILRQHLDANSHAHPIALSNQAGTKTFYVNKGSATNSLLPNAEESEKWASKKVTEPLTTLQVPTTTLDLFCKESKIKEIDILKMDAQGGELAILQGASLLLKRRAIRLIYTEVLFVPLYEGQPHFHDIALYLSQYGYKLFDLFQLRYAPNGQLKWGDAIFTV